jgi:hypothetical protein
MQRQSAAIAGNGETRGLSFEREHRDREAKAPGEHLRKSKWLDDRQNCFGDRIRRPCAVHGGYK